MSEGLPTELIDALRLAPFEPDAWTTALEAAASRCNASSAQILAYGGTGIPMLLAPGFTDDDIAEYLALGGGDASVNRGMAFMTGTGTVPLRPYADYEYMSEADRRFDPLYNDFFAPRDGAHMSVGVMVRNASLTANLSFMRTEPMEQDDRQATAHLLPAFARACELQFALEGRSAAIMAQALNELGDPILICDSGGRLVSATRSGESVLQEGRLLALRNGRLTCPEPDAASTFQNLVQSCAPIRGRASLGGRFIVRTRTGLPARIDVAPMPGERGPATLRPMAMIRVHAAQPAARMNIDHVMSAFGLTRAEAQVAEAIISGLSSRQIARERGVTHLTVHSQARSVLAKTGCARRNELSSLLAPFALH